MSQPDHRPNADRNLLFGILALNMDFVSRDALVVAMQAWVLDKHKPLGQILIEQGRLNAEQASALDTLIVQHVKAHGDDPQRSLQALPDKSAVRSLLAPVADDEVQTILGTVATGSEMPEADVHFSLSQDGSRYRILGPHAKGGLGEVFVAKDSELNREVALKEIQPQFANEPAFRARFLLEGEITGGLEHPGIVPVYGLGVYSDGRPYYAMRFIRGTNFREAIKRFHAAEQPGRDPGQRSLELRQLLDRFIDVCKAIAYAHSRGVLHRDLKPENVMLGDRFGETLVVDWGLAKVGVRSPDNLEPVQEETRDPTLRPLSGSDLGPTLSGGKLGTLGYASPEQWGGRLGEVRFPSDIYSLGATLYMLLTGRRAFHEAKANEIDDRVRCGQFASPREVKPGTPPALDAICRKAMALQPADRYQSALDLAGEVEHWLADEPVDAYPEPWTARAGRWARRHRAAVVGAGVFLASAVVALSISTALVSAEQRRTAEQKRIAVDNYTISREQSFKIIKLIETTEPELASVPALHDRREELLTTASDACRQFREQDPDDLELVERTAQIYRFTANFDRLINENRKAGPLYEEAVALQERLIAVFPDETVHRLRLADLLRDQASLQFKQGRFREGTRNINRSLEIIEGLPGGDPQQPSSRRRVALALLNLARIEFRQGKHVTSAKPMETIQRSEQLFRGLLGAPPGERHSYEPLLLATALNLKAMIEREAGKLDDAMAAHNEAVALLTGMRDKKSKAVNQADVLHLEAECRVEQSKTWAKIAKPNYLLNAEKNINLALARLEELAQEHKKIPTFQESLAAAILERGLIREQGKEYKKARTDFESAKTRLADLVNRYPDLPELRGDLGLSYAGLGRTVGEPGNPEAATYLKRAVAELQTASTQSPEDAQFKRLLMALAKAAP